jgi:hypothetical protein
MRLAKALSEKVLDVRLRDKLLAEGKLTKKDLEKQLEKLDDDTKNARYSHSRERLQHS